VNVREVIFVIVLPLMGPMGLLVSCWLSNGYIRVSLRIYESYSV
jgi:hypothetical protein